MDRYVRVKKIGQGSFGKALLVKKKADGRQCVIKEIGISKMSPKEREESRKEMKVLAQLKHPNIVSYQESFEENGNLYIVMDYCEGGDLYQKINGQRGILFPEEKVMDLFVQICLAMKHVHDRKILHRDLKSQNIFLTKSGIVKLGDFGIARVLHSTVELARTCIGTPYYLSPEICENRPYNNKSDIWSLGCVLYELLTLKHAFEAGNMKNLVLKIIRGSYPPITYKYSADIRGLVAQLLKRNPHDRPSVNSILKKPFIQKRIMKFLSEEVMAEEFSHTVIHRKPLGVVGQRGAVPRLAKPVPAPQKYSDPKAKYGVSVAKKKAPPKKPSSAELPKKPARPDAASVKPVEKKKELDARERRRREMMQNQEQMYQDYMKKVQQQRWERQQREQINRAREQAWKATLNVNLSPEKAEKKPSDPPGAVKPSQQEVLKKQPQPMQKYQAKENDSEAKENRPARPLSAEEHKKAPAVQAAARPVSANEGNRPPRHRDNLAWDAAKQGEVDRALGAGAAERARVLEDFWNRKREAARNKARGQNFNVLPDHYPARVDYQPKREADAKDVKEKEYLARLEAIRRQNFLERQEIQRRMAGVRAPIEAPPVQVKQKENVVTGDPRYDPEARRKKIAALKAQAEERAAMLRAQLEERKKAILAKMEEEGRQRVEKEKQRIDPGKRPLPALAKYQRPAVAPKPVVAPVGLETALKQVGANKLFRSSSEGDIQKMIQEAEEPLAPRKAWGDVPFKPRVLPLEVTASAMEATSAEDAVLKPAAGPPRKLWGQGPKTEVMAALGNAKLQTATTTVGGRGDEPDAGKKAQLPAVTQPAGVMTSAVETSGMGATVTVDKTSSSPALGVTVVKSSTSAKTVIVKKEGKEEKSEEAVVSDESATITLEGGTSDGKAPSPRRAAVSLETISEGTLEEEKLEADKKVEDLNLEDIADAAKDNKESGLNQEKPCPKSPTKAWGEEVKTSTPTKESPEVKSPKSPHEGSSLAADRAAYQDFLNASRKISEDVKKEALFERVEHKEQKKEADCEDLEVQDISIDDLSFHTADGSPNRSRRTEELQTGQYDTVFTRLRTCSLPDLRMLFKTTSLGHAEPEGAEPVEEEEVEVDDDDDDDDDDDEQEQVDEEDGENGEDDNGEEEELELGSGEEESEEFEDMLQSMRDVLVSTGRSPSPVKSLRGTSSSLDWDHIGDTCSPQGDEGDGVELVRSSSELSNLNEDWDSGEEDEDDGDSTKQKEREKKRLEDEESVFQRLEESRLTLEQELGIDKFLRVYKFLQAVQENEDDSAEIASAGEIGELLGDKEHLYPKILYLVIADSAYSEDNQ